MKQVQAGSLHVGGDGKLFVMAGPCVIEDPDRILKIGQEMKAICGRLGLPYILRRPLIRRTGPAGNLSVARDLSGAWKFFAM